MDWVLVQQPCSGLGTLRRNPDLKWKWTPELVTRLVQEQRAIFAEALEYVKKGGHIVYATCSILPQENEEQLAYFLKNFSLTLVAESFKSLPTENGMDGFFAITLQKSQ
jgi:16S rRNA C967 or C1407 C5-methylase (RsmB/RsmF family)